MSLVGVAIGVFAVVATLLLLVVAKNALAPPEHLEDKRHPTQWPPQNAKHLTIVDVEVAGWMVNVFRALNGALINATIIYEARTPLARSAPAPSLAGLCSSLVRPFSSTLSAEGVRWELSSTRGWRESWLQDLTHLAVFALCHSDDPEEAITRMITAACDDAPHVQRAPLVRLLLTHHSDPRLEALARRVFSESWAPPEVRACAAVYLNDPDLLAAVMTHDLVRPESVRVADALSAVAPARARSAARQRLSTCLPDRLPDNAGQLVKLLAAPHQEDSDVAIYTRLLDQAPHALRLEITNRLSGLGCEDATTLLVRLVDGPIDIAGVAVVALARRGDRRARPSLLKRLADGNNNEQIFAAYGLQKLGTLDDVAPLMAVRDRTLETSAVRAAASEAITILQANAAGEQGAISLSEDQTGLLSVIKTREDSSVSD